MQSQRDERESRYIENKNAKAEIANGAEKFIGKKEADIFVGFAMFVIHLSSASCSPECMRQNCRRRAAAKPEDSSRRHC